MTRTAACIASILLLAAAGFAQSAPKDLLDVAATERAFAAMAVKERWQTAFIQYFADDGIGFGPHPERTKEVLQKRGIPTTPRTIVFNWAPHFGDISAAGDLAYSTGPVLFTDVTANPKPPTHGIYFSVWQKQADGTWKVAIDIGVDTPQAVAPIDTEFRPAKQTSLPIDKNGRAEPFEPLDKQFSDSIAKASPLKAYRARVGDEFRIHRNSIMPVVDKASLETLTHWPYKFEFIAGKVARSNDLAFTYGKYSASGKAEEGYYVHVWRRDAAGKWKLVVDVQNALPKNQ